MKKNSSRTFWVVWLPIFISLAFFIVITFLGNVLVIGSKLGGINFKFELGFYCLLIIIFCWLVALPLFSVFMKPVLALEDVVSGNGESNIKNLIKVAKELVHSEVLPDEQQIKLAGALALGGDISGPMAEAIKFQIESSKSIIRSHAVSVFVSTTVSQNGKLDAISVLFANLRLVNALVNHFGYRPPFKSLIVIYAQIFIATFIADQLDDINSENFFNTIGAGFLSAIPGSGLLINSLLDGAMNAVFTLRVGYLTKTYLLNAGKELNRSDVRKNTNSEARNEFIPVMKESLPILPGTFKQLVKAAL